MPVMALPIAHMHHMCHILQAGIVRPGLSLHSIIHTGHNPVHLPLALVPGLGVYQEPIVQAHLDQDPMLGLMPHPEHLQKVAFLMGQVALTLHPLTLYCCRVMMMILPGWRRECRSLR